MRKQTGHKRANRAKPAPNPRYDRSLPRSGRLPITLIDGSTRAAAAASIQALAAAIHYARPCYAAQLQRVAAQVADTYTAAQAVSNYTTLPTPAAKFTEAAVKNAPISTTAFHEGGFHWNPL